MAKAIILAATTLVCGIQAQFLNITDEQCTSSLNAQSIASLPGFDSVDQELPCMHSGFIKSNNETEGVEHNLFYWMYKTSNWTTQPVTIFLNGGPGASSTFANFLLNGPLQISEDITDIVDPVTNETTGLNYTFGVDINPIGSWADNSTMIYIDQPIGTGFSYSEPTEYLTNMEQYAAEWIVFMKNLYEMYPEFKGKELYMTGESYSGKYLPVFSLAMLQENANLNKTAEGVSQYNLKATLIGDGYPAPYQQRLSMYKVPQALNILDQNDMPQVAALERLCGDSLLNTTTMTMHNSTSEELCAAPISYAQSVVGGDAFGYDMRIFGYEWDAVEAPVINYFSDKNTNNVTLYTAIHVENSTKVPVFEMGSEAVDEAMVFDNLLNYVDYYEVLVNNYSSPILIYDGEFDARDGAWTQNSWLKNMTFTNSTDFWDQSRQIYWVPDSTAESGYIVGGYYRQTSLFNYLTVPKAGHFVPNPQLNYYKAAYAFFTDYLSNQALTCQRTDGEGCSVASKQCTYMANCFGLGSCGTNGQCTCNNPGNELKWKGADCSLQSNRLVDGLKIWKKSTGPKWWSFYYDGTSSGTRSMFVQPTNSNVSMDVYVSVGSDSTPTEFEYDFLMKNMTGSFALSSDDLPQYIGSSTGFTAAFYVNGIVEQTNTFLDQTIEVSFTA